MNKFMMLPLVLVFVFCVSCGWDRPTPWEPSSTNTESNISSLEQGGVLEIFDTPSGVSDDVYEKIANSTQSLIDDPTTSEEMKEKLQRDLERLMECGGEAIDLSQYVIPSMPPREEQDPNLDYFTIGHGFQPPNPENEGLIIKNFHFAVPIDFCGAYYLPEEYGGGYGWILHD